MPPASQRRLEHGQPRGCRDRHDRGGPVLGQPLCPNCFDYPETVLWNAHAGQLWNRTVIGLRRALARLARVRVRDLSEVARVSFVKVVEYQARGVVHLHAVVRLDGPDGGRPTSPQRGLDVAVLAEALRHAAAAASVPVDNPDGTQDRVMWGDTARRTPAGHARPGRARWRSCGIHRQIRHQIHRCPGRLDRRIRTRRARLDHGRRVVPVPQDAGHSANLGHVC